jgi:hypothetical protein
MGAESYYSQYASKMLDNGYIPVPLKPNSKVPGSWARRGNGYCWGEMSGWQNRSLAKPEVLASLIKNEEDWPNAGVGAVCGRSVSGFLSAMDCDVDDEEDARRAEQIIRHHLGDTPLKRIGRPPRFTLLHRSDVLLKNRDLQGFQVLADRKQFVVQNIHPITKNPYTWLDESPADVPFDQLPLITQGMVDELLKALTVIASIKVTRSETTLHVATASPPPPKEALLADRDVVEEAMSWIPNEPEWNAWNNIGMAVQRLRGCRLGARAIR